MGEIVQLVQFGQQLNNPVTVCLGYFGSMHKGHVELLRAAKQMAAATCSEVALFTFGNNHLRVLGKDVKSVYTFEERLQLYESLGVQTVIVANFDENFRATDGRSFLRKLSDSCQMRGAVCGFDYRCGSDRLDANALSGVVGCPVRVVEACCHNGVKVSTTLVRDLLLRHDIAEANELLSEPFFITGEVVHGRHVGSSIGFCTANLRVDGDKLLPMGVFGGSARVDGCTYKAIINIGGKPTFGDDSVTVEVHLIDFSGDLYGKTIKTSLTRYLRGVVHFDSSEQLVKQLEYDRNSVLNEA